MFDVDEGRGRGKRREKGLYLNILIFMYTRASGETQDMGVLSVKLLKRGTFDRLCELYLTHNTTVIRK